MSQSFQNSGGQACAIILAAGVGRRLASSHQGPKCLLQVGEKTLLQRLLEALERNGVRDISITVGHEQAAIRAEVARLGFDDRVTFVKNPRYREGSLVSLWTQRERLHAGGPVLLMDADVLCDARMVARLGVEGHENRLLLDRDIEPGDEPVKICLRGDAIVDFRKIPDRAYDAFGESVGFFRFSGPMAALLWAACDTYMEAGAQDGQVMVEYEEAIRDLILAHPDRFGVVEVSDLPWTEIDFEEDVARARRDILPELIA
ncbi:MAG: phosphocholine cytidylyltransferase family protein [Caulobacteraceae bacterium]